MQTTMKTILAIAALTALVGCASNAPTAPATRPGTPPSTLDLGAFSVSLAVKDLAASRAFYQQLGFEPAGGDPAQNWQILRNGDHVIGLFQGMFPKNILTFNPGWTQQATPMESFVDVREIQARLLASGLALTAKADPASTGPASLMLVDPDGNQILVDQHVGKPK